MVMVLLVMIVIILVGLVAGLTAAAAVNAQNRRPLPPPPPHAGEWPGYHGPSGPIYPAYNPAQYLSPDDRERIMVLIRGGQKIQAIKLYRGATGAGLAEARAAVEYLERFR